MRKSFKLISVFLVLAMILPTSVLTAKADKDVLVSNYEETREYKFMSALSFLYPGQKDSVSTITRAEFALWILKLMNMQDDNQGTEVTPDKFLGYVSNSEYDENGDWVWKSEVVQEEETSKDISTPFKDVTTEHELWNSIKLAAQLGIMRGNDGYLRPEQAITGNEVVKILVDACGAKVLTGGVYPSGYMTQAKKLGITSGIEGMLGDYPISYETALKALYNVFHAEIYLANSYSTDGTVTMEKDETTLLEYWWNIKFDEGIVERTRFSGLKDDKGFDEDKLEINGNIYDCNMEDADLLGKEVRVYYDKTIESKAVYFETAEFNKEIIVSFDDIVDYDYPNLEYWDGSKSKELYIGVDTNIIYNGKALVDYDDSIFNIKNHCGNIRFLNADKDNKYETAFITKSEVFWIKSIDYNKQKIYDQLGDALSTKNGVFAGRDNSVDLSLDNTFVFDEEGNELSIENMLANSVCFVQRTLPSQGEVMVRITYSTNMAVGRIEEKNDREYILTVDGKEYKVMDFVNMNMLNLGEKFEFYLTPDGRIAAVKNKGELILGYLVAIGGKVKAFNEEYRVKIYDLTSEEMKVFDLTQKLKFNKSTKQVEYVATSSELYNLQEQKTIRQPIKYSLDANGKVNEILTGNYDEHLFCVERVDEWYGYRGFGLLFGSKPAFYLDATVKYFNIPLNDNAEDKSYYKTNFENNKYYSISFVCRDDVDSNCITAAFRESDASSEEKVSSSAAIMMVRDVQLGIDTEGTESVVIYSKAPTYDSSVVVYDPDIIEKCADINAGDLIRVDLGGNPTQVIRLEKVFDVGEMRLTNPVNPSSDSWSAEMIYLHGSAYSSSDNGGIVAVVPYVYASTAEGIAKTLAEPTRENKYQIFAQQYNIVVFDSKTQEVINGSYLSDIILQESSREENNVVVSARWGDPNGMFVYR